MHPSIQLVQRLDSASKDSDRGVIATADIAKGEELMAVPIQCCIYLPDKAEYERSVSGLGQRTGVKHASLHRSRLITATPFSHKLHKPSCRTCRVLCLRIKQSANMLYFASGSPRFTFLLGPDNRA